MDRWSRNSLLTKARAQPAVTLLALFLLFNLIFFIGRSSPSPSKSGSLSSFSSSSSSSSPSSSSSSSSSQIETYHGIPHKPSSGAEKEYDDKNDQDNDSNNDIYDIDSHTPESEDEEQEEQKHLPLPKESVGEENEEIELEEGEQEERVDKNKKPSSSSIDLDTTMRSWDDLNQIAPSQIQRAVIYRTAGGFGNKWYGLVSAMMFAVITDRAFYVDWNSPWRIADHVHSPLLPHVFNLPSSGIPFRDYNMIDSCFDPATCPVCTEIATISDLKDLISHPGVSWYSNCNTLRFMVMNANARRKLNALGLTKEGEDDGLSTMRAFGTLLHRYFALRPGTPVAAKFAEYKEKFASKPTIGLQIRLAGKYGEPAHAYYLANNDQVVDFFVECARHIESKVIDKKKYTKDAQWFVASDHEEVIAQMQERFGRDKVICVEGAAEHSNYSGTGAEKVVLDAFLMSETDVMVITPGSTFGGFPALRSMRPPYFADETVKQAPHCTVMDPNHPPTRRDVGGQTF